MTPTHAHDCLDPVRCEGRDKPVHGLYCACCGGSTRGRQWHNQDTGYGICCNCIAFIRRHRPFGGEPMSEDEIRKTYGIEGVHWGIDTAYGAVIHGREFTVGLAEENEPGFWPMPSFGMFPTYEAASTKACELNEARGLSAEQGALVVASSMAAQNRRGR